MIGIAFIATTGIGQIIKSVVGVSHRSEHIIKIDKVISLKKRSRLKTMSTKDNGEKRELLVSIGNLDTTYFKNLLIYLSRFTNDLRITFHKTGLIIRHEEKHSSPFLNSEDILAAFLDVQISNIVDAWDYRYLKSDIDSFDLNLSASDAIQIMHTSLKVN